jgi:hypothetical protein
MSESFNTTSHDIPMEQHRDAPPLRYPPVQGGYPATHKKQKLTVLVLLIIYAPLTGVLAGFESSERQDYLLATGFLLLGYLWCRLDAAELQRKIRRSTAFALVFFPLAGYPDYFYRVRG